MFRIRACLVVATLIATAVSGPAAQVSAVTRESLPEVLPNDNRRPAGTIVNGTLALQLRAAVGLWRPLGDAGPSLTVEAFGEAASPLTSPAPLIRVPVGTEIVATIRNDLDVTLRAHGLCSRDSNRCAPVDVPPSASREVRFSASRAGTYHYWATTTGMPLMFRGAGDTQLSGALIVDPPGARPDADRVFVITDWTSLTRDELSEIAKSDDPGAVFDRMNPKFTVLVNGLSWPATERLTYRLGDRVKWRVINLSSQRHPMHMHGFYYEVDSLGDGLRDVAFPDDDKPRVVTQLLSSGTTMMMTWTPERIGNWLFHCHIREHVAPERRLASLSSGADHSSHHDMSAGMAGLALGVTIDAPTHSAIAPVSDRAPGSAETRKLTLVMQSEPRRYGAFPAYGFVMHEDDDESPSPDRVTIPGPTLVLRRGQPVEITLVNHLPEATAIHWHGMELESYYDGVHGWSGAGTRVTPLINPGSTFVVRFTPPSTGTFMYHTHLHDDRQLASGLYGAMLVVDPAEAAFDASTDHVFLLARGGPGRAAPVVVNGGRERQFVLKAGARHRVRLINITPDDVLVVALQMADGPVTWRPLTKDGAPVPRADCEPRPARQMIAAGETYDFEYQAPAGRATVWMEVRGPGGKWQVQAQLVIKS